MSRIGKNPISIPSGVEVKLDGQDISVKGPKGELTLTLHPKVAMEQEENLLKVSSESLEVEGAGATAMAGTMRALVANMVVGVSEGFVKKMSIVGVGYRAQAQGSKLNLSLGFSHPVVYEVPKGINIETPTQTEIVVSGADKQQVGQIAAEIRAFRPPEPYKGKGIRYVDEYVLRKQAKKK
jgi:large subunit ribosomal protein L6